MFTLIFDFDGVLINSSPEIEVTAFNSISQSPVYSSSEIPDQFLSLFRRFKSLSRNGGHMTALAFWCKEQEGKAESQIQLDFEEFLHYVASLPEENRQLEKTFFSTRSDFIKNEPEAWINLNQPYEPIWSEIKKYHPEQVILITNKNLEAVLRITQHYELSIPSENIYPSDLGNTKTENFLLLHEKHQCSSYLFVEDSITNLKKLSNTLPDGFPFGGALASWGFVTSEDIAEAKHCGYEVLDQQKLISYLEKGLLQNDK